MAVRDRLRVADLASVPAATGRNAYRIVQEGLTNARSTRPAPPSCSRVAGAPGDGLEIEVRNPLACRPRARRIPPAPAPGSSAWPSARTSRAAGSSTAARRPATTGSGRWLPWPA